MSFGKPTDMMVLDGSGEFFEILKDPEAGAAKQR